MDLASLSSLALTAYLVVLSLVCIYGVHRYFLVVLFYRGAPAGPRRGGKAFSSNCRS